MSGESAIEWTDATWNPVTGCDKVSPGCAHCYALTLAKRLKAMGNPRYQVDGGTASGPGFGVTLHPDKLDEPLRWRRPRMVFVNSMSDLFHEDIPDEFIARVFATMALAGQHTFQVLTKRPERMQPLMATGAFWMGPFRDAVQGLTGGAFLSHWPQLVPLPNVWLGVTIENRRFVQRADLLRETPAAVRFVSAEPLLGPVVKEPATTPHTSRVERGAFAAVHCRDCGRPMDTWQSQCAYADCSPDRWPSGYRGPELDLDGIDWLIAGGESGPEHRPMSGDWVRDLRAGCRESGTAFFFKQWGGRTPKAGGRELDGRTYDEMPQPVAA